LAAPPHAPRPGTTPDLERGHEGRLPTRHHTAPQGHGTAALSRPPNRSRRYTHGRGHTPLTRGRAGPVKMHTPRCQRTRTSRTAVKPRNPPSLRLGPRLSQLHVSGGCVNSVRSM